MTARRIRHRDAGGSAMDLAGSADRSYRVVFVRLWRTEERHDCVTHEVIDVTAELGHSREASPKSRPSKARSSSGSHRSDIPVNPERSEKQDCHLPAFASERIRYRR